MSKSQYIAAHEPEEELLSPEDAWEDYLSLEQALAEKRTENVTLQVDLATKALVHDLVTAGVCQDESEVVARAVQSFFVATYPQAHRRLRLLRESREK
jgi:hypothetical protein